MSDGPAGFEDKSSIREKRKQNRHDLRSRRNHKVVNVKMFARQHQKNE